MRTTISVMAFQQQQDPKHTISLSHTASQTGPETIQAMELIDLYGRLEFAPMIVLDAVKVVFQLW